MAEDSTAIGLLHFITNAPGFFDFIKTVTGCGQIGSFMGRVYCLMPGQGHTDWHNDRFEHRLIGMSLNLSEGIYSGGIFELRSRSSNELICKVENTGFGDAFFFRIGSGLEHRVTEVTGEVSKTAFAGWFMSEPDFHAVFTSPRPTGSSAASTKEGLYEFAVVDS